MITRVCVASLSVLGGLLVAGNVCAAEGQVNINVDSTGGGAGASAPSPGMHNSVSLLANLGYAYSAGTGFGLSGRYQFTIVPEGVIHSSSIHDDFGIEPAVDFFHYSWDFGPYSWTYNEFGLSAAVVWNLWFTKEFAAYPRLGLGFAFGSWSDNDGIGNPGGYGGLVFVGGAGVLYQLGSLTLRAELNNASLGLGVAINL
ncbi:MAG: hypothetical protein ABI895_26610 [Deltaproteobacteria bacterium]